MDENNKIPNFYSYGYYQNNINNSLTDRMFTSNNFLNNFDSFGNFISNYKITVNNPLFKQNNFFLKSNNNSGSRLVERTKKISRIKSYYDGLKTNQNYKNLFNIHTKNNKSLNNPGKKQIMNNYYSNIYINNEQYTNKRNVNNIDQIIANRLKNNIYENSFNNNSFVSIYSYKNNDNKKINKSATNIFTFNYPNKINIENHQNEKIIANKNNMGSPYLNIIWKQNNNINGYNYDNKTQYNDIDYKRNNAINFNENIDYNNIINIKNKTENSFYNKMVNYNQDVNHITYNENIKKKINIKIYPNYQKIKTNQAVKTQKRITKINLTKNNLCLKCQKLKLNYNKNKNYNIKEPNNYAFHETKNIHSKKCYNNNHNSNKENNLTNINHRTEPNINSNTNIYEQKPLKKLNDEDIISIAKKNYENFLKKNNHLKIKDITNINKRKRAKSKNQIDIEKNLDKKKSLSYRERLSLKPSSNSKGKNKTNILKSIPKTLSQKKYKEDDKGIVNRKVMKDIKSILFKDLKDNLNDKNNIKELKNINRYNNIILEKQIGCQFSILKINEKNINECLNGIVTYFNSENLRNKKMS